MEGLTVFLSTDIDFLGHLSGVRPYSSSLAFLTTGSFFWVLSSSITKGTARVFILLYSRIQISPDFGFHSKTHTWLEKGSIRLDVNPNCLANQLRCIGFLTPHTPLIIPHRLLAFLESLMLLKNWCSIHVRCSKSSLRHSIRFCDIFSKFKTEFYRMSFF